MNEKGWDNLRIFKLLHYFLIYSRLQTALVFLFESSVYNVGNPKYLYSTNLSLEQNLSIYPLEKTSLKGVAVFLCYPFFFTFLW